MTTLRPALPADELPARLRLLPTPTWDPPYVDAAPDDGATDLRDSGGGGRPRLSSVAGHPELDLTFVLPGDLPATPEPPLLHLVPRRPGAADDHGGHPDEDDADDAARTLTSTALLPDARGWAGRLALAAVEVLAGTRPLPQLRRWTSDDVYAQLRRQSHHGRVAERRHVPLADPPRRLPLTRVRTVRVCEPGDGVVEASVVVDDGLRVRALALRLEGVDGRWRCVELSAP